MNLNDILSFASFGIIFLFILFWGIVAILMRKEELRKEDARKKHSHKLKHHKHALHSA